MSTKQKPGTSRSSKKKPVVTTPSTGDVTKKKSPAGPKPESPEKTRLKDRDKGVNAALQAAFGTTKFDSGDPPAVVKGLEFDATRLTELAEMLKDDADKLTKNNSPKQFDAYTKRLEAFNFRLEQAQATAARIKKIEDTAAAQHITLTDRELADVWQNFTNQAKANEQEAAASSLRELEARLDMLPKVLAAYNQKSNLAPADRLPEDLFTAAGTFNPIDVLRRGLALVASGKVSTVSLLRTLLRAADPPANIPDLVPLAQNAGIAVLQVLSKFPDEGNATEALYALRAIDETGQTAAYFTGGRGGQRWIDLAYCGRKGVKIWPGGEIRDLELGPIGGPSITFDELRDQSVRPRGAKKKLDPDQTGLDPHKDRYMGKKPFVNDGIKRGVVLPYATREGVEINYVEYDIRPYTAPHERGAERLVVGYGRKFYTDDHYKTFREVR